MFEEKTFPDINQKERYRQKGKHFYLFIYFLHKSTLNNFVCIQPSENWKPVALLHLTVNSDYLQSYVFVVVVVVFQVEVSIFSSRNEFAGSPLPTDSSSPRVHSSELKMLSVTVASFALPV